MCLSKYKWVYKSAKRFKPCVAPQAVRLANRHAPIDEPIRVRLLGACGKNSLKIAWSKPKIPIPLGPPAAPGIISTSCADKP